MFPLGSVLFPSAVLPLHVFEPRYRALVDTCLAGTREFGVVLIERGSEVGGGDVRTDVGTVARIVEAEQLPDGRSFVVTVGVRRIRVAAWLPDDPYPIAEVDDWLDDAPVGDLTDAYAERCALLRRVLGLKAELGEPAAPVTVELAEEPVLGAYQIGAVAPLGPADQQAILRADTVEHRLELLGQLLGEEADYLARRLALS
jgi:Lon protease-like protein